MMRKQEDLETYYYHLGLDFVAKISLESKDSLQRLEERFKKEAALSDEWDSVALRSLSNICRVFNNE